MATWEETEKAKADAAKANVAKTRGAAAPVHRTTQDIVDVWDRIRYRMPGQPDAVIDKIYEVMEKLAVEIEPEAVAATKDAKSEK